MRDMRKNDEKKELWKLNLFTSQFDVIGRRQTAGKNQSYPKSIQNFI